MVDTSNQQSVPRETSDRMPTAQRGKRPAAGTLWQKVPGKHIFENAMQIIGNEGEAVVAKQD